MINFKKACEYLIDFGIKIENEIESFHFDNPEDLLDRSFKYFCKNYVKLPEYNEVSKWMMDTDHRGLFLYGMCGRGKTIIAKKIMPIIFSHFHRRIFGYYDASEINDNLNKILKEELIIIDDIGTESVQVRYGERRMAFCEIVDAAEKYGKLLIITSNLEKQQIIDKYGIRTFDRLLSITKRVYFNGNSLRQN